MASEQSERLMHANLFDVFGEREPEKRLEAIRRTYTDDVIAADPDDQVQGYEALSAKAQTILDGAPGFVFQADGDVYEVQDALYLGWALGPEGQPPVARGADLALVRGDRISKIYTVLFH